MNSQWQIDLYDGLNNAVNMQDVLDVTLKIVKPLGYDYVGWKAMLPMPMSEQKVLALNTAEDGTIERIGDGSYDYTPVPQHCSKSIEPISWLGTREDWLFNAVPEVMEDVYSCGRFGGWAQSFIESKRTYNMFWVDTSFPVLQRDINNTSFEMQWIATSVLAKMNKIRLVSNTVLSNREKEVLKWFGDGKTSEQIGMILNLSHSTINFHFRNAMKKLGTHNKTSTIVKAIYLNLLH